MKASMKFPRGFWFFGGLLLLSYSLFLRGCLGPGKDQTPAQRSGEQQFRVVRGAGSRPIQEERLGRRLALHPEHDHQRIEPGGR